MIKKFENNLATAWFSDYLQLSPKGSNNRMYHSILKHILCLGYGVCFISFNFQHSYILLSLPETTRLCPVLLAAFIILTPECQQSMPCGDYLDTSGTLTLWHAAVLVNGEQWQVTAGRILMTQPLFLWHSSQNTPSLWFFTPRDITEPHCSQPLDPTLFLRFPYTTLTLYKYAFIKLALHYPILWISSISVLALTNAIIIPPRRQLVHRPTLLIPWFLV